MKDDRGFILIEALVTLLIFIFLLGTVLPLYQHMQQQVVAKKDRVDIQREIVRASQLKQYKGIEAGTFESNGILYHYKWFGTREICYATDGGEVECEKYD